jgi:hypothetical protein
VLLQTIRQTYGDTESPVAAAQAPVRLAAILPDCNVRNSPFSMNVRRTVPITPATWRPPRRFWHPRLRFFSQAQAI